MKPPHAGISKLLLVCKSSFILLKNVRVIFELAIANA
jgi:hypothetical protein